MRRSHPLLRKLLTIQSSYQPTRLRRKKSEHDPAKHIQLFVDIHLTEPLCPFLLVGWDAWVVLLCRDLVSEFSNGYFSSQPQNVFQ
eukprot:s1150_g4.t1